MTIQLRKATLADLNNLLTLENLCFTSDKMSRDSYRHLLRKNTSLILLAEDQQTLIGSATLFFRKNSSLARLYSLAVQENYRSQGIAALLLAELEMNAKQRRCIQLTLEVRIDNLSAIRFYQRHGYDTFGTHLSFYEDGTDALRMRKQLTYENP